MAKPWEMNLTVESDKPWEMGVNVDPSQPAPQPARPVIDPNAMVRSNVAGHSPGTEGSSTLADTLYNSPIYQFMRSNAEIPVGMGGAAGGAMIGGAVGGPPGAMLGSVVGGAIGSGGGSLLSDKALGEEYSFAKAAEEMAWSIGTDLAFLGLSKWGKSAWARYKAGGKSPAQLVEERARAAGIAPKSGTPGSRAQSQYMLSQANGTLTPSQTGNATAWESLKEQLGSMSLWGRGNFSDNAQIVTDVASAEYRRLMSGATPMSASALGEAVYSTIYEGRKALGHTYDLALKDITAEMATNWRIPTKRLEGVLDDFVKDSVEGSGALGSRLNKETLNAVEGFKQLLDGFGGKMPTEDLLVFENRVRGVISEMSDPSNTKMFNTVAARDLAQLSDQVRTAIMDEIKVLDPKIAAKYGAAKAAYKAGYDELLPKITTTAMKNGGKEMFETLGRSLTSALSVDKVNATMKSLDRAFLEARRAGVDNLPFASLREARNSVRVSYLDQLFKGAGDTIDVNFFSGMAKYFDNANAAARMQAILGESYGPTKRLMNLMADATQGGSSDIGQLWLRTKEYAAGTATANALSSAATGSFAAAGFAGAKESGMGVSGALAILGLPKFWATVATDPATANRMIAFSRRSFSDTDAAAMALTNLMNDLVESKTEYADIAGTAIKEYFRNVTNAD